MADLPPASTAPVDVLEALLFASDAPLEADRIREVLDLADVAEARALVDELRARLASRTAALQITEAAGGYRMVTRPELAPWLIRLARSRTRARLSRPALETLAIVGYRQPVSRPEIDAIRGVNSDGVLESLLERRLIRIAGRKEAPGRPFLYETTREFLVAFGLRDVTELPKVEGELVVPDLGGESAAPVDGEGGSPTASEADASETDASETDASETDATETDVSETDASEEEAVAHGEAPAEQDPGPGGTDVQTGR